MEGHATITLVRRSPNDVKQRHIFVSLDGQSFAELAFGQLVSKEVPAGSHTLRAHNTLVWKTEDFCIAPGEQIFYEAINRASISTYFFLGMFLGIAPLWVTLRRMT